MLRLTGEGEGEPCSSLPTSFSSAKKILPLRLRGTQTLVILAQCLYLETEQSVFRSERREEAANQLRLTPQWSCKYLITCISHRVTN
ncbi:hypothetical protein J6590_063486 [Homalodisca vitripennis]|nr:hypothetical protein J6590_063486 [Homalodisca vitripennis]